MRLKNKPWGKEVIQEHKELVLSYENLDTLKEHDFLKGHELVLEIGSGKGDFVIGMSKKHPEYHYLAVEMQSMALAYAIRKLEDEDIDNILMVNVDAHFLFEKLGEHKFNTIFLNFSDPWPKKRHNKRRLTYPTMLEEYAKVLKKDGKLIFKSDNDTLFNDSLEYLKDSPFEIESVTFDYDGLDEYDAPTEYEKKFRSEGVKIKRLIAKLK